LYLLNIFILFTFWHALSGHLIKNCIVHEVLFHWTKKIIRNICHILWTKEYTLILDRKFKYDLKVSGNCKSIWLLCSWTLSTVLSLSKKQDGFLDKDKMMDNVQEHSNHKEIYNDANTLYLQSVIWKQILGVKHVLWNLKFSQPWLWRVPYSGMWHSVDW
jgi:hypothetical protein